MDFRTISKTVKITLVFILWQLLDWLLGKGHSVLLRRAELKTLVDLHANEVISIVLNVILHIL